MLPPLLLPLLSSKRGKFDLNSFYDSLKCTWSWPIPSSTRIRHSRSWRVRGISIATIKAEGYNRAEENVHWKGKRLACIHFNLNRFVIFSAFCFCWGVLRLSHAYPQRFSPRSTFFSPTLPHANHALSFQKAAALGRAGVASALFYSPCNLFFSRLISLMRLESSDTPPTPLQLLPLPTFVFLCSLYLSDKSIARLQRAHCVASSIHDWHKCDWLLNY